MKTKHLQAINNYNYKFRLDPPLRIIADYNPAFDSNIVHYRKFRGKKFFNRIVMTIIVGKNNIHRHDWRLKRMENGWRTEKTMFQHNLLKYDKDLYLQYKTRFDKMIYKQWINGN